MPGPSQQEVDSWMSRIEEVTAAVKDIMTADPMDDVARHQARERRRKEMEEAERVAKLQQVKMRYEPKNYARYERDDFIDALLKEVDAKPVAKDYYDLKDESLFTRVERVSLTEARRLKDDGAKFVQSADWAQAFDMYDRAIKLLPVDPRLMVVLHNNRALTANKLGKYMQAFEDASYVLQHENKNVKALLRRATALRYLHRPVEALEDVTNALHLEPNNSEGIVLRTWLCRAEEELMKSNRFIERQEKEAKIICDAAATLGKATSLDEVDATVLNDALEVAQTYGTGASVLFALRGGVAPTITLTSALVEKCGWREVLSSASEREDQAPLASVPVVLSSLRLLAVIFDGCETVTQDAPEDAVNDFIQQCSTAVLQVFATQKEEGVKLSPFFHTITNATLECLTSLYPSYTVPMNAALEAEWRPLTTLWKAIRADTREHAGGHLAWVTLYHFTRLLSTCMQVRGTSIRLAEDSTSPAVVNQLFEPSTAASGKAMQAGAEMILDVVEHCLYGGVPLPIQTVGVALAIKRTSVTLHHPWSSAGTSKPLPAQFKSKVWSQHLCDSIAAALRNSEVGGKPALHPHELHFLEACYSLVYNLAVSTQDRVEFVKMWQGLSTPSFCRRTWDYVAAHRGEIQTPIMAPALSKMLGVLSKFVSKDDAVRRMIESSVGDGTLPTLWCVLDTLAQTCAPLSEAARNEVDWELLEHVTTILAMIHHGSGPGAKRPAAERIRIIERGVRALIRLIQVSRPPSETAVNLWKATATSTSAASPSTLTRSSLAIVALGNASILIAALIAPDATPDELQALREALTEAEAVDVLLETIRSTRSSALLLARERADAESKRLSGAVPQLKLWEQQTLASQKNLGIAISKVVTSSDEMRQRLRDLNGLETLAAVLGK